MGFVERELARIRAAIGTAARGGRRYDQLYAAQRALEWTTEPQGFAAPLDMIEGRSDQAVTISGPNTLEAPVDCSAQHHQLPS